MKTGGGEVIGYARSSKYVYFLSKTVPEQSEFGITVTKRLAIVLALLAATAGSATPHLARTVLAHHLSGRRPGIPGWRNYGEKRARLFARQGPGRDRCVLLGAAHRAGAVSLRGDAYEASFEPRPDS